MRTGKKWSHLECPECIDLRNAIYRAACACKRKIDRMEQDQRRLDLEKRGFEEKLSQHYAVVDRHHVG